MWYNKGMKDDANNILKFPKPLVQSAVAKASVTLADLELRTWKLLEKIDELDAQLTVQAKYIECLLRKIKKLELESDAN